MDHQPSLSVFTVGAPVPVLPACAICSRPSIQRCTYCVDGPAYCSSAHLQEDWQFHVQNCHGLPSVAGWKEPALPSQSDEGEYVRALKKEIQGLFLEASSYCGKFTRVTCHEVTLSNGRSFTVPDVTPFLSRGHASLVLHYDREKQNLDHPLHVFYCPYSFVAHDNWNNAVDSLMDSAPSGRPARHLVWPGNIVFLKYANALCTGYEDITDGDLETVRAYFEKLSMWR
ncbi:hypothetical protein OH77DRAFT_107932, partial [Trametes cingulata]